MFKKNIDSKFEKNNENEYEFDIIMSTDSKDRDNDIIKQDGIKTEKFEMNPIVLFNHDRDLPIARVKEMKKTDNMMVATVQFPEQGISAKSDEVRGLLKSGILNASSIGFNPVDYDYKEEIKGYEFKEVELLELSIVSIPANSEALAIRRSLDNDKAKKKRQLELIKLKN